jgi:hypothetical protein
MSPQKVGGGGGSHLNMFCAGISLKIEDHEGVVTLYLGKYGNLPLLLITKNNEL